MSDMEPTPPRRNTPPDPFVIKGKALLPLIDFDADDSVRMLNEVKTELGRLERCIQAVLALDRGSNGGVDRLLPDGIEVIPSIMLPDGSVASGVNVSVKQVAGKQIKPCVVSIIHARFDEPPTLSRWALIVSGSMIAERDLLTSDAAAEWVLNPAYIDGAIQQDVLHTYLSGVRDMAANLHDTLRNFHDKAELNTAQEMNLLGNWEESAESAKVGDSALSLIESIRHQSKLGPPPGRL